MTKTTAEAPVRWGVLGTAKIATKVGRAIRNTPSAQLAGIASRDFPRARAWGAEQGAEQVFESYAALVDSPDIDAVYIPLPPNLHPEWVTRAADRGKHVLCEKPIALSAAAGQPMIDAYRTRQVQFMDGVMWRHHDRTAEMKNVLRSGGLGELRRMTAAFTFFGKDLSPNDIRFQQDLGGGSLGDLGWYCIGAALWAFDELPTAVQATARYETGVDRNCSATMWFSDHRIASFDCGFDIGMRQWFEIAGTEGSLVCDDYVQPRNPGQTRFWTHDVRGQSTVHETGPCVQEERMIEHFCQVVRCGELQSGWPAEALAVQRVCDAIGESARRGTVIELG
jgi:predicted dehydrogenase